MVIELLSAANASILALAILGLTAAAFALARRRAISAAEGDIRRLHSLPSYYGNAAAMMTAIPALLVLAVWLLVQPWLVQAKVTQLIPAESIAEGSSINLVMSDVRRISDGIGILRGRDALPSNIFDDPAAAAETLPDLLSGAGVALGGTLDARTIEAAATYQRLTALGHTLRAVVVILVALAGMIAGMRMISVDFRARNTVEKGIRALLILAASLAILTTVGIVLSMLFESINFFRAHPWQDFFFGDSWSPNFRGDSDLSILPLLWGTLYISFIALAVAVPIGLYAAIYLSEYADNRVRSIAKPLLEILAGIPTIVYGLFALLTVGPFLVSVFGRGDEGLLGVDWMNGATSVLTAGLVMGIMLIPFVSSLSDDIINAVPQSLRDGSYGLGATHSETIRQVVLPAALPGIVGAVLLAASRAIGETMIVVLGAGAIARISGNPLEAMTTITTRIVSQLTGDSDFASPETLVAFALGLTLFVLTLGLNVLALYIVRKYREQYE